MKKLLWMFAISLLLAACGDGTKNKVENTSGTALGEVLCRVKALAMDQVDLKKDMNEAAKEVSDKYEKKSEGKSNKETRAMVEDYMKDVHEATKGYQEDLDCFGERYVALGEKLSDKEIPAEIADGTPLKLVEPLKVKEIAYNAPNVQIIFQAQAQTTVEPEKIKSMSNDYGILVIECLTKDGVPMERKFQCYPTVETDGNVIIQFDLRYDYENIAREYYKWFDDLREIDKLVIGWEGIGVFDGSGQPVGYAGELGLFELRGKVKQCTWLYAWGELVRTFDENGFWLTNDGQDLTSIYTAGVERDGQGRIIKGLMDIDGNGEDYAYNADGSKKSYNYHYFDEVTNETYKYNENGVMTSMAATGIDGERNEEYTVTKVDAAGNWIERKTKTIDGDDIQTRKIVYY